MDTDVVVAIRSGLCTVIPQAPGARITVNPSSSSFDSPGEAVRQREKLDTEAPVVVLPDTPEVSTTDEVSHASSLSHIE